MPWPPPPEYKRAISRLAQLPKTPRAAVVMVCGCSCVLALLHWGFGTIAAAIFAREVAASCEKRGIVVSYALLGAAAYSGFAVWHGGFSGSAPLAVATPGHFADASLGVVPLAETVLSFRNVIVTGGSVLTCLLVVTWFAPKCSRNKLLKKSEESSVQTKEADVSQAVLANESIPYDSDSPNWLHQSTIPGRVVGAGIALVCLLSFFSSGVTLNNIVLAFLGLAIGVTGSLSRFASAVSAGSSAAGAILVQFPLYFGVLGLLKASGLVQTIGDALVSFATEHSFVVVTFLFAGIVNFFVPSGGGQWALQGELLATAGNTAGVLPGHTVMAFAYGDAWTNMLQPFWALPLLGIMGLRAKDIMGYCIGIFCALGVAIPTALIVTGIFGL